MKSINTLNINKKQPTLLAHLVGLLIGSCLLVTTNLNINADALLDIDGVRDKNIRPQINQQEFKPAQIDDEKFEFLLYAGAYKFEGFDSRPIVGLKAAYHFENKFFAELDYGSSSIRGPVDPLDSTTSINEDITLYDLGFGYNLLNGQGAWGNGKAINSSFYLKYAIGKARIDSEKNNSRSFGAGLRLLMPNDKVSVQIGMNNDKVKAGAGIDDADNIKIFTGIGIYF